MRVFAACTLTLAVALTACGGGSSPKAAPPTVPPTTVAPTTTVPAIDPAVVTAWTTFFNAATPPAVALGYLQNGSAYAGQLATLGALMPKGLTAKVEGVTPVDATHDAVTYELLAADGHSLLGHPSTGQAVMVSGKWLVSASTFCGLVSLAGTKCAG